MADLTEVLQAVPLGATDWDQAARLLEQSVKSGNPDPNATYLLAICYKHLGRTADARHLLNKIQHHDGNVHLQRGVLAFRDSDFASAAQEFSRSLELEPASYPAGHNLLLARLCQGQVDQALALIPQISPLTASAPEQRFLQMLQALLRVVRPETSPTRERGNDTGPNHDQEYLLGSMSPDEEARLVDLVGGLGSFEVAFPLLSHLMSLRPHSQAALTAYFGAALVQGKDLMDRFQWEEAYSLLSSLHRKLESTQTKLDNLSLLALFNMLGTCSCLLQDFERGAWYFRSAQEIFQREQSANPSAAKYFNAQGVYQGAWLEQNLALAYEWHGKLDKAESHWNRYFDYLEHYFAQSKPPDYLPSLAFEGLMRLADVYSRKEKWSTALGFLQRAHRVRPSDFDVLERLFTLYSQLKKPDEARRILRRLREARPNDPQVELFELDARELSSPEDVDRLLSDIRRVLQRHTGDLRVEERSGAMINNLVPALEKLGEQFTAQINKVIDQMRRLPSYQINWPVVRNVMRDLEEKFFQLRRVSQKVLSLLTNDDLRRDVSSLVNHCDRKIDQCHSLGE
ncbi:MAG: tetratricopeptide repeat protein [Gemmataceae bacterium]|nr:tetratricopeptide repeat protein [Gemmataceae bacterium]MCI0741127.1 tetratricopeptide repeat protein [Gemmataceae bacterium]